MAERHDANRLSMSFKRQDVCLLLDALEFIIADFKYDGGLVLAEDYMLLQHRLHERLMSHDRTPYRRSLTEAAPQAADSALNVGGEVTG